MKWNSTELFETFKRECSPQELVEVYKALIAVEIGVSAYTDKVNDILNHTLDYDFYGDYNEDNSLLNERIVNSARIRCWDAEIRTDNY